MIEGRVVQGALRMGLAAAMLVGAATLAEAVPAKWTIGSGGNDHWYDQVTGRGISWTSALAGVPALPIPAPGYGPGYLATITSAAEQAFIAGALGAASAWIGASDAAVEGVWMWVSEPGGPIPMVYSNWAPGEPNDFAGEDYAVHGWSGTSWNDLPDVFWGEALVEWSPSATPPPPGVPAPAALILLGAGLIAAGLSRTRMGIG